MSIIKKKSKKQENKIAKDIKGKVTMASGALYMQKADVRNDEYLIEAKTTEKKFYSLKYDIWNKIAKEALRDDNRIPLMHIQLLDGKKEFVIMSINTFLAKNLDMYNYVGNPEPILTEKKSVRITHDMLDFTHNGVDFTEIYYPRCDIKFVEHNEHLVVLAWEDFLLMEGM